MNEITRSQVLWEYATELQRFAPVIEKLFKERNFQSHYKICEYEYEANIQLGLSVSVLDDVGDFLDSISLLLTNEDEIYVTVGNLESELLEAIHEALDNLA